MINIMQNYYEWFKAIHIIAVISWMAGMLYLPRLYVYHSNISPKESDSYSLLCLMEHRLIKFIITPAILVVYIMGGILTYLYHVMMSDGWFHVKMLAVFFLTVMYFLFIKYHKDFVNRSNSKSPKFYRIINECVTLCMCIAVFMIVLKPWD